MDFGAYMFSTDYSIRPDDLAKLLEDRGFESMWLPEHTHIPASRKSPFPGGRDLPKMYWHTYDPFVALTAAAAVTTNLKLGTGICLVIEHDPIVLAKQVASLDRLSNGRFIFGIGGGWNTEEMANHGTDYRTRMRLLRERVLAMKEIWTKDEAEYHGRYFDFPLVRSYPKPLQKPYPPIILGGMAKNVLRRVIAHADGWLPNRVTPAEVEESRKKLDAMAAEAGRDPKSITISVYGQLPERDIVHSLLNAGADRVVVRPEHVETEKEMGEQLERMAEAVLR